MPIGFGGLGTIIGGGIGFVAAGGNPMGAAIGASLGGSAGGLVDAYQAGEEADALREQQLSLARERRAKWESVFGPVQESLAETYRTLTPESYAASGLMRAEQDFEQAGVNIRQNIARRDLAGSGIEQDLLAQAEIRKAETKAEVRAEAPLKVAEAKQSFLSLGMNQAGRDNRGEQSVLAGSEALARREEAELGQAASNLAGTGFNLLAQGSQKPKLGNVTDSSKLPLDEGLLVPDGRRVNVSRNLNPELGYIS